MRSMSVEVLRLRLSSRNLVTTGNRIAMAKRLHSAVSSEQVGNAPLLPQLERTAQLLVDKSLEGLETRLQASQHTMLYGASAPPPAAEDDNISMPSADGAPALPSRGPEPPAQSHAALQLTAAQPSAETNAHSAVIVGTTPAPSIPPTTPPAVPTKLRQRILRGEYVDFDALLPESMFPARFFTTSTPGLTLHLTTEPSSGGDGGEGVATLHPKQSVSNLSSWLEACNTYMLPPS